MREAAIRVRRARADPAESRFPPELSTERTVLRRIGAADAQGWKSFNNAIAKRMDWPIVPSVVYARNEILHYDEMWERGERCVYIILEKGTSRVIGDFHLKDIDRKRRTVEFGHALHPSVWGTGITYETLDAVRKAAEAVGLRMWAKVEEENVRSWRSLEKYGAVYKGTRPFTINKKKIKMRVYELA